MTETTKGTKPGDLMRDGTVYAGSLEGKDIYATPEDAPLTYTFNQAAEFAEHLNREKYLGHDDWRVPDEDELNVLCENSSEGALKGTFNETGSDPAGWYWSASPHYGWNSWGQHFGDGCRHYFSNEFYLLSLRCVRR